MTSAVVVWVVISVSLASLAYVLGYMTGRMDSLLLRLDLMTGNVPEQKKSFLKSQSKKSISIDESKVVVDVDTSYAKSDGMELGEKTVSIDDISDAKQKLSQLKRGK